MIELDREVPVGRCGLGGGGAVGAVDVSPFPEVLRAQRRHLALLRHHHWWHVDTAISDATLTIYNTVHADGWTPPSGSGRASLAPAPGIRPCPGMLGVGPGDFGLAGVVGQVADR